jgi:hypothetical protein
MIALPLIGENALLVGGVATASPSAFVEFVKQRVSQNFGDGVGAT